MSTSTSSPASDPVNDEGRALAGATSESPGEGLTMYDKNTTKCDHGNESWEEFCADFDAEVERDQVLDAWAREDALVDRLTCFSARRLQVWELSATSTGWSHDVRWYALTGRRALVAARNAGQALGLVRARRWLDPDHIDPGGIVSVYERGRCARWWCGCVRAGSPLLHHGDGVRALRRAVKSHEGVCERVGALR